MTAIHPRSCTCPTYAACDCVDVHRFQREKWQKVRCNFEHCYNIFTHQRTSMMKQKRSCIQILCVIDLNVRRPCFSPLANKQFNKLDKSIIWSSRLKTKRFL